MNIKVNSFLKCFTALLKGGEGSGNFGHEGRPGEQGGSGEGDGSSGSSLKTFSINDIDEHKMHTSSRAFQNGRDFSSAQSFSVPGGLSSEQWQDLDIKNSSYSIYAHGLDKAPSKKDAKWKVFRGSSASPKEVVADNLTYNDAVKRAKEGVLLALKNVKR